MQDALGVKLDLLHEDVGEMKIVLKELAVAINRLAIVEERQTQAAAALERAFVALEKVELRVDAHDQRIAELEKAGITSKQTNDWVGKAVWAAVAALAVFVGKKVDLL